MRKFFILIAIAIVALLSLAMPASATGGGTPSPDNKKIPVCHATGSATNPYTYLPGVPLTQFLGGQNGHVTHAGDIWATFTYVTIGGQTVTVPGQGDQSLLATECVKPVVDEEIVVPDINVVDKCGTDDDEVTVPKSSKYTSTVTQNGLVYTVVITANKGFTFPGGVKTITKTYTLTDVDCGLPATGIGEQFNTMGGYLALGGLVLGTVMFVSAGRRRTA